VRVSLVVDRSADGAGIWALLWTAEDDDPRLLQSKKFRGEASLKVWLAGLVTRYGRMNIEVQWTNSLQMDARLATVLKESLGSSAGR
jgi:hypothetical protein